MTPELKTEFLPRSWWTCSVETHRHAFKHCAEACIVKEAKPKPNRSKLSLDEIMQLHRAGIGYAEIAAQAGVKRSTIREKVAWQLRREAWKARQ